MVVRVDESDVISYVNEPPDGRCANVIALPLHLEHGNAVAYYACERIGPHTELWTHYGDEFVRDYPVGKIAFSPRKIQRADTIVEPNSMKQLHRYCAERRKNWKKLHTN